MDKITIRLVDFTRQHHTDITMEEFTRSMMTNQINKSLYIMCSDGKNTVGKAAKTFQTIEYRPDGLYARVLPLDDKFGQYLRERHSDDTLQCGIAVRENAMGENVFRLFLAA